MDWLGIVRLIDLERLSSPSRFLHLLLCCLIWLVNSGLVIHIGLLLMHPPSFKLSFESIWVVFEYVGRYVFFYVFLHVQYAHGIYPVSGMFNWLGICLTAVRFRAGLRVNLLTTTHHTYIPNLNLLHRLKGLLQKVCLGIADYNPTLLIMASCAYMSYKNGRLAVAPTDGFYSSWVSLIILFADWSVFLKGNWDHAAFISNYFPIPLFFM
jgi:hypothetical protein